MKVLDNLVLYSGAQRVYHFVVFRFGIKPFVLKKGDKYQGVVDMWKEAGCA